MSHPATRPRRTRQSDVWRRMVREARLSPDAFIYPLFAVPGRGVRHPVSSMPGVSQLSVDELVKEARAVAETGVPAVLLFAAPSEKDARATAALDPKGLAAQAISAVKDACPDLLVWADVCLCGATDHGHCGHILPGGAIDNDASAETLAQVALNYARAGADAVAPSDMMDGRVQAMRRLLDGEGHAMTPIVSYAAKYASSFYGPFREAAESAPAFGDRRSYQMDPANSREALREVLLDIEEGADLVMVKPAGPYLDVIRQVRDAVTVPVVAYQVSGEYSLIKAAAERGWINERAAVLETLTGIRRAGADLIISYFAPEVARWLAGQ
ncbi:MAG TPA: porphobilinogen synthase [Steroidobacteraceae bacterium]|nr:porphobilinogen synthase [Steroidobacteraceae bacterium]